MKYLHRASGQMMSQSLIQWLLLTLCCCFVAGNRTVKPWERPYAPDPVPRESLRISEQGSYDNFNLTWRPSSVENATVFYKVTITYTGIQQPRKWDDVRVPFLTLQNIRAYTKLHVSLLACTQRDCVSEPTLRSLYTPMGVPSDPTNPVVFVTHQGRAMSTTFKVRLDFQWSPPAHPAGPIINYQACYALSNTSGSWSYEEREANDTFLDIRNATINTTYYFKVKVCIPDKCSDWTHIISTNTTVENPVPVLLEIANNSLMIVTPNRVTPIQPSKATKVVSVTYIAYEDTFYWLDDKGHVMQTTTNKRKTVEVVSVNASRTRSVTVDWISRDLYWVEDTDSESTTVMAYDLNTRQGAPIPLFSRKATIGHLRACPYGQWLFWTEEMVTGKTSMMHSNMVDPLPQPVFPQGMKPEDFGAAVERRRRAVDRCNCQSLSIDMQFTLDTIEAGQPQLYIVDRHPGSIWLTDLNGCVCQLIVNATNRPDLGLPPDSMAVDMHRLMWTNVSLGVLNSVDKYTGANFSSTTSDNTQDIVAWGQHLQPLPGPSCLSTSAYPDLPDLINSTNTSLVFLLPVWEPDRPAGCEDSSPPATYYTLLYRVKGDDTRPCDQKPGGSCQQKGSYRREITLSDLQPYTDYLVQVAVSNVFMEEENMTAPLGEVGYYTTEPGVPSSVRDVVILVETPERVNVTWIVPAEPHDDPTNIQSIVEWSTNNVDGTSTHGRTDKNCVTKIQDRGGLDTYSCRVQKLNASQLYQFKVLACDRGMVLGCTSSNQTSVRTFQRPGPIILVDSTSTSLTVDWRSPSDHSVRRATMVCHSEIGQTKFSTLMTGNATYHNETFNNLKPYTKYSFSVNVLYNSNGNPNYTWPVTNLYEFLTAADVPAQPSDPPSVEHNKKGADMVIWSPPNDRGSEIVFYQLYVRPVNAWNDTQKINWTSPEWPVNGLVEGEPHVFQVAACNILGCGQISDNSSTYVAKAAVSMSTESPPEIIMVIIIVAVVVIFIVLLIAFFVVCRRYKRDRLKDFRRVRGENSFDAGLETIRGPPPIALQTTNTLYAINIIPTDEDVEALPHFPRENLQLEKFLGSGAFGEVYEGVARNILTETSGDTRVAVKTLRKGATDQEKEEFLKEALLMSNFKQEHILRLLGVCLETDPQFIVLDLMEGGDLLSYLRTARPTPTSPAKLRLTDMVCICRDIADGCAHLEDLHFVHRDIAARNCLVSSRDPQKRSVKIGDFGLARDIYKNDYYRKEGEGLLPVRWMSPESLIDGVFTTQSDVWAFGVLMWEVLTLGQQPYPARTNVEVLQFVRGAGRLDRPDNCPDDLYHLMLKCWSFTASERPSFHHLLQQLQACRERCKESNNEVPEAAANTPSGTSRVDVKHVSDNPDQSVPTEQPPQIPVHSPLNSTKRPVCVKRNPSLPYGSEEDTDGYLQPLKTEGDRHKYLQLMEATTGTKPKQRMPLPRHDGRDTNGRRLNYAQLSGMNVSDTIDTDNPSALEGYYPPGRATDRSKVPSSNGTKINYAQLAMEDMDTKPEKGGVSDVIKKGPPSQAEHSGYMKPRGIPTSDSAPVNPWARQDGRPAVPEYRQRNQTDTTGRGSTTKPYTSRMNGVNLDGLKGVSDSRV